MYKILYGSQDSLEQQMNELASEGWRFVSMFLSPAIARMDGVVIYPSNLYAIMERKHIKSNPPTVQIQEGEKPYMGRT